MPADEVVLDENNTEAAETEIEDSAAQMKNRGLRILQNRVWRQILSQMR